MVLNPSRNIPASSFVCFLSQSFVNVFVIFFLEHALTSIFSISINDFFHFYSLLFYCEKYEYFEILHIYY